MLSIASGQALSFKRSKIRIFLLLRRKGRVEPKIAIEKLISIEVVITKVIKYVEMKTIVILNISRILRKFRKGERLIALRKAK